MMHHDARDGNQSTNSRDSKLLLELDRAVKFAATAVGNAVMTGDWDRALDEMKRARNVILARAQLFPKATRELNPPEIQRTIVEFIQLVHVHASSAPDRTES